MIDLHSHVLPGVDDGTRTIDEALAMVETMLHDGVTTLAATPHVREDYPTTASAMETAVDELRSKLHHLGLPLTLLPGGEIAYDELDRLDADERARFGLGGNPHLLLLELPTLGLPLDLIPRLERLREAGTTVVIAHPERHPDLVGNRETLGSVARTGALLQVTAAALDGRLGRSQRSAAHALVDEGFAHLVASDAHRPGIRAAGMSEAVHALGDPALGRWLTDDAPRALLAGELLPPRPPSTRRRRRLFGR